MRYITEIKESDEGIELKCIEEFNRFIGRDDEYFELKKAKIMALKDGDMEILPIEREQYKLSPDFGKDKDQIIQELENNIASLKCEKEELENERDELEEEKDDLEERVEELEEHLISLKEKIPEGEKDLTTKEKEQELEILRLKKWVRFFKREMKETQRNLMIERYNASIEKDRLNRELMVFKYNSEISEIRQEEEKLRKSIKELEEGGENEVN